MISIRFIALSVLIVGLLAGLAIKYIAGQEPQKVAVQNPDCVWVKTKFFNTAKTAQGNISFWDSGRKLCRDGSIPVCRFIQPGTSYSHTVVTPDNKLVWARTVASQRMKLCSYRAVGSAP